MDRGRFLDRQGSTEVLSHRESMLNVQAKMVDLKTKMILDKKQEFERP